MKQKITWRSFHKYAGLILAFFLLVFCVSGIILNHRTLVADCNVSRMLLPSDYHITNYNNGIVKGTVDTEDGHILIYGCAGVWKANSDFTHQVLFNQGLPNGVDGRNIKNIVRTKDGSFWCAATFGVYRHQGHGWKHIELSGDEERISDITLTPDSVGVVVTSRSNLFTIMPKPRGIDVTKHVIKAGEGQVAKVPLFKTIWMLHSGELFGIIGRYVVDLIAVVLIILSLSGIILFVLPQSIKRVRSCGKTERAKMLSRSMRFNLYWHNKLGALTLVLTLVIVFTGMCLRPPLMIPLVLTKTKPLVGTTMDSDNPWHDKLRAVRWDEEAKIWLLSTSEGFFKLDESMQNSPIKVWSAPPVSPMGVTVFCKDKKGDWLIGSFSGLFRWNLATGNCADYFTGKPYTRTKGMPIGSNLVAGLSQSEDGKYVIFEYDKGAKGLPPMSADMASQPMSLWNVALELHVGRCYTPFLGPFSVLFIFTSGLLILFVLISGYIRYLRINHKVTITTKQQLL